MKKNKFIYLAFTFLLIVATCFLPFDHKIAKANVFGDLNTTNLLYPALNFDSILVQKDSNLLFADYPNRWDVDTMPSAPGNQSSLTTNGSDLVGITSSTSSAKYVTLSKVLINGGSGRYLVGDYLQPKAGTNPYRNTYGETPMWATVDLIFTANDFVIKSFDLLNTTFNVYKFASTSLPGYTLNYNVSFDLYSKSSSGLDYAISTYSLSSGVQSIDLGSSTFANANFTISGSSIYQYNFNPFIWAQDALNEEEEYVWISNLVVRIGLSSTVADGTTFSPNAFGWDIPYYTSDLISEMTGYSSWLTANGLDSSDIVIPDCPECEECPVCSVCPGEDVNVDFTSWIAVAVGGFLGFEIFPGFSLIGILAIVIAISLVLFFLKMMRGG